MCLPPHASTSLLHIERVLGCDKLLEELKALAVTRIEDRYSHFGSLRYPVNLVLHAQGRPRLATLPSYRGCELSHLVDIPSATLYSGGCGDVSGGCTS